MLVYIKNSGSLQYKQIQHLATADTAATISAWSDGRSTVGERQCGGLTATPRSNLDPCQVQRKHNKFACPLPAIVAARTANCCWWFRFVRPSSIAVSPHLLRRVDSYFSLFLQFLLLLLPTYPCRKNFPSPVTALALLPIIGCRFSLPLHLLFCCLLRFSW